MIPFLIVRDRRLIEELTNYFRVWTDEGCHVICPVNLTGFQLKMDTSQIQNLRSLHQTRLPRYK